MKIACNVLLSVNIHQMTKCLYVDDFEQVYYIKYDFKKFLDVIFIVP